MHLASKILNNSIMPGETVADALNNILRTYVRQRKVIDVVDGTIAPPTEVLGDRYILNGNTPTNASWDGASANDIVEFDGTVWVVTTPQEGYVAYVDAFNNDALFVDDGTPVWEVVATRTTTTIIGPGSDNVVPTEKAVVDYIPTVNHNALANKQGGATSSYLHYRIAANLAGLGAGTLVGELGTTEDDDKVYKRDGASWIAIGGITSVSNPSALPATGVAGDVRLSLSNNTLYVYTGTVRAKEGEDLSSLTNYLGTWNANTNTPTIVSGTGNQGDYYKVAIAGTTDIDGNNVWGVNDIIRFDGQAMTWNKIDNQTTTTQRSVYAKTVAVSNTPLTPITATYSGHTLSIGQPLLLVSQTTQSQNGLYIFAGIGSPLVRSPQFLTADDILGTQVRVTGGSYSGRIYYTSNTTYTTPGSTSLSFLWKYTNFNRRVTPVSDATTSQSRTHSYVLYNAQTANKTYVLGNTSSYTNYEVTIAKYVTGTDNGFTVTVTGAAGGNIVLRRDRDAVSLISTGTSWRLVHWNIGCPSIDEATNISVLAGVNTDVTIYNIKSVMPVLQATISATGEVVQIGMQRIDNQTIRLTSDVNITVDLQYITLSL